MGSFLPDLGQRPHVQGTTRGWQTIDVSCQKVNFNSTMVSDPAKAWMKSMAAHHRGAIEMSQIIMRHTKNAEVLAEARKTVDDNQRALAELQAKMR